LQDTSADAARDQRVSDVVQPQESSADLAFVSDSSQDGSDDGSPADGAPPDAPPPSPYKAARGLIHMHSIYSHDACDGEGFIAGKPNTKCLQELRDAICANDFDFVFLTDHPANMKDYTLVEDMLHDAVAGDQLVKHGGVAIANRLACKGGAQPLVSVGFEAKHMMPLGLHALPATPELYDDVTDMTDLAKLKKQVAGLKKLGAVVAMVHSEEADISAATIDAGGFEAMEWYNIHASILQLANKDTLSFDPKNIPQITKLLGKLIEVNSFMVGGTGSPHPDLSYLLLLDALPPEGFEKWRTIIKKRPITGVLGSDIHRNVSVDDSMCAGAMQLVCVGALGLAAAALGAPVPTAINDLLLKGGTVNLSDGDRIDSYDRLMRWLENRVLVKSIDQLELQEALRQGRTFGVFTVFGDPPKFSFTASQAGAADPLQMGASAAGPLTLEVRAPDAPVAMRGPKFTAAEAQTAKITVKLLHGAQVVASSSTPGATLSKQISAPGAYHVEVWIKPLHLEKALGSKKALASEEYLWVISNPIYVK
jgi:hypothetical protein